MKLLKNKSPLTFKAAVLWLLGLACCLLTINAKANLYLDVNGTTSGFGITNTGNFNWDDNNWTTDATGVSPTTAYPTGSGNFPRFTPAASASFTITLTNDEHMAGLFTTVSTATMTINSAGGGFLDIDSGDQGFLLSGTLIINAPIGGTGGLGPENNSSGAIKLFGTNTYSGGTPYGYSGAPLTYFNNPYSFGTGPIKINSGQPSGRVFGMLGTGGATITLTNAFTIGTANTGFNWAADPNTPVVLTGNWTLGANTVIIQSSGGNTSPLTVSGAIGGTGGVTFSANGGSETIVSGANTYSGQTVLTQGANPGTIGVVVSVNSLNSVSGGVASSSLGHPTTVANGTIGIGSTTHAAQLIYTGPGETSDRVINLPGTTGGAILEADGTGALVLTANNTATGAGVKNLTLQGTSTAANSIGKIVNGSGTVGVVKAQGGTWKLTGANTYTGGTTVNAGTLEVSGSVAGNVTNNTSTLILDSNSALASTATAVFSSSGTVNLNFSGAQPITALIIDGVSEPANQTWGALGSGAQNTSALFTGSGILFVSGAPVITQEPQSQTVFPDASATFSVVVIGDPSFTYQWKQNGTNVSGGNGSSLTISPAEAANAGTYICAITNTYGFTNTQPATLTILATNSYVNMVRGDFPVSYWRLDETNGTTAFDWIGGNNGVYNNVTLNQSGFSALDSDPSVGLAPLNNTTGRGYMQVGNVTPFAITAASTFSLEAWGYFTNFNTKGRLFSTLSLSVPSGYAFGVLPGGTGLEFTAGAVADNDVTLSSALVAGVWYHLVCVCDGNFYYFYVNGAPVGNPITISGHAVNGTGTALQFGANPPGYVIAPGDRGAEQLNGRIDEAAFYNYALSPTQVTNHYAARYSVLQIPVVFAPIVNPPTNYQSLSATLQANAAGTLLNYQWYKAPSTLLTDQTNSSMTLSPLQLSDGGDYYVQVSNPVGTSNSPTSTLTVLAIPTNASQLNLTGGLVLHLPFDSDFADISGRGNNGTSVGATLTAGGAVGSQALHYETAITPGVTNYVTLGVRPDLKFSSNVDFTVSYWVRQINGSGYTNLPFFGDAVGSTGAGSGGNIGFVFAPYQTATTAGGWQLAFGGSSSMSSPSPFTTFDDFNLINDGNWHHLVHVATRAANVATYLDGVQVDSEAISFIGNISNTNAAVIGQDPTGGYPVAAQADLDDLGVWRRTLSQLEISGIYLAGRSNGVSFATAGLPAPIPLQLQQVSPGQYQLVWSGSGWTLQAAGDVFGAYTNVPGATSPYPISTSGPQLFYRLKY